MTANSMQKVFVLGASRTGTTSLHKFLRDSGYSSVHYFTPEVDEIAKKTGSESASYTHFKEFVDTAGFNAFSDYPTRLYYRELFDDYPDAHFILSRRADVEKWVASMKRYFSEKPHRIANLQKLTAAYSDVNEKIRELYRGKRKFLEISIDGDGDKNTEALRGFLNTPKDVSLSRLNYTVSKK